MLEAVIRWSLNNRLVVVLGWLGLAGLGIDALTRLPIDAFPDTTPIQVQVNTSAPALPPLEIERQLTRPIEQALSGLPDLTQIRSLSRNGFSQVTLVFSDDADLWRARQVVTERLAAVDLPNGVTRPTLGPVATGLGEVFHYLVTDASASPTSTRARTEHDWLVAPRLREVSGVAEVVAWGGYEREYQVLVDPTDLMSRGLSLGDLITALADNNLIVGGGTLDLAGESTAVIGEALITTTRHIEDIVVATTDGRPVLVRDVARVVIGHPIRRGAVTANGKGEVVLGLAFMLMGGNSHEVTRRLEHSLAAIKKTLPPDLDVTVAYERTTLVDEVLTTVKENLLEAALLVIAILFIFLGSLRAGLIVALAIPLSMLCAFDLMLRFGVAGSLMSLGAIDFGMIVDSSVIMVENAERRLHTTSADIPHREVVLNAALEVRRPTLFGELVIMAVYLPILTLEGHDGKLFVPMALTVVFALSASMLLSVTLMPVLASLVLRRRRPRKNPLATLGTHIRSGYRRILASTLRAPWLVTTVALIVLGNAAFVATRLGVDFVPRLMEGSIVINTVRLASVSLDESIRYGTRIEQLLKSRFSNEIETIWTRTGTAEVATDPMGLELSDVFIMLKPRDRWTRATTQAEITRLMQDELSVMPGMRASFLQPIEMRVNEMVGGIRSDIGLKLFGEDLTLLKEKAREVEQILKTIPGSVDVVTEQLTGAPMMSAVVDREAIARHGLSADEVLQVVAAFSGIPAGELQDGERRFPIAIRLEDHLRVDADTLGKTLVTTPRGERIPLSTLARLVPRETPATINREWGQRRVVVQANVRDRDLTSWVQETRDRLESVVLPAGYRIVFGGQYEQLEAARARLTLIIPISLFIVLLLLYLTYGRWRDALRIFASVPFSMVGGVLALWLADLPLSVSAAVGFIAVSGVSVLGDMVLVSTLRQHLAQGMPLTQSLLDAATTRLRPVLMTSLVAALGFLPMALNTGIGAEVQRPLATVVIGGLFSSTLLTLFVLPSLYVLFTRHTDASPPQVSPAATPT
jgi:cobalt-zinc-cadmium resistance protein CzcA